MMHWGKNFTGNTRFYGFCVDLLEAIADILGFAYDLELAPERIYGARDPVTGEWNGIVRELMRHVRNIINIIIFSCPLVIISPPFFFFECLFSFLLVRIRYNFFFLIFTNPHFCHFPTILANYK